VSAEVSVIRRNYNADTLFDLDFLPEDIRTTMEQGYAYKPSAPAPLHAALPPVEYPREAFGTRSSVDLVNALRANHRSDAPKGSNDLNGKAPHVLFDTEDIEEGDNGEESNDWGNSDEESNIKRAATPTIKRAATPTIKRAATPNTNGR
jgi:hypothetical protein